MTQPTYGSARWRGRDPDNKPDPEANAELLRTLKAGDRLNFTLELFSANRGYSYRRYTDAEVGWIRVFPNGTFAGNLLTGQSANRSRIWLNVHRMSHIELLTPDEPEQSERDSYDTGDAWAGGFADNH